LTNVLEKSNYKGWSEGTLEDYCYCCGNEAWEAVKVLNGALTAYLCIECLDGEWEYHDGFYVYSCTAHGHPDLKGMVDYWAALDLFNEKWGTRKTGTRPNFFVNWQEQIEKLRIEWRTKLNQ